MAWWKQQTQREFGVFANKIYMSESFLVEKIEKGGEPPFILGN
jgi:hypothetical protein